MPYSGVKSCPICCSSQKDLSAHLRNTHKLSSCERQCYLHQVKRVKKTQPRQQIESPTDMEDEDLVFEVATKECEETPETLERSSSKFFVDEDDYRLDPKEFSAILQHLSVANIERMRQYIKKRAPEDFITFLRSLPSNVEKFDLTYDQFFTMKNSKLFQKLGSSCVHRRVARKLMTTDTFLKILSDILPQLLKLVS